MARKGTATKCRPRARGARTRDWISHYVEVENDNGRVAISQSKTDWAAELGLTRETPYRALSSMVRMGELSVDGRCLLLTGE
jgi:CRP-like cAMP-binding protein